ncbi:NnrU family protein [Roseibium alexandrii]|uniref:Putative membrane protein n=1 Tax=Roseibium alexandrii (strain DSM 17067 / NCIMB 14079 / DFL-11) TaxID=244592 RepID=A0A5E8GV81_ROSAD|nr:NnrU family protein [Roseibium alexandrii]EEE43423.2 putative membrane protein [Roseibium alexandrii DFL-11]
MFLLIAGLILFLGIHSLPMFADKRAALEEKFGVLGYKGLFAVVSAIGFVMIIYGYGAARAEGPAILYDPPFWLRHVTMLFMIPVFIFLVAAYVPCRIKKALKHPMLVAVKMWAFSHLLTNGDLASVLLFGSFLVWAVADRISLKRRGLGGGAVMTKEPGKFSDIIVILVGLGLYVLFALKLHMLLIGVPVA